MLQRRLFPHLLVSQKVIDIVLVSILIKCLAAIRNRLYQYLRIYIISYKELLNILPQNGKACEFNHYWYLYSLPMYETTIDATIYASNRHETSVSKS